MHRGLTVRLLGFLAVWGWCLNPYPSPQTMLPLSRGLEAPASRIQTQGSLLLRTLTLLRSPRNLSKAEQTLKGSTLNSLHLFSKLEQNSLLLPHNLMTKQRPTQPGGEP